MPEISETLVIGLGQKLNATLRQRAERLAFELTQDMQELYQRSVTVSSGGISNGIAYEFSSSRDALEFTFGFTKTGFHLAVLEFGERGTEGGTGLFKRTKAPRVKWLLDWLSRSSIPTPRSFVEWAERNRKRKNRDTSKPWNSDDPRVLFAFAIARKRKRFGRPAMHLLTRYLQNERSRIAAALQG